jgi:hypothetical protein
LSLSFESLFTLCAKEFLKNDGIPGVGPKQS